MDFYKGSCNQCGKCCKLIPIAKYKEIEEWKEWLLKNEKWLQTHDISEVEKTDRALIPIDRELIFAAQNFVEITDEDIFRKIEKTIRPKSLPPLPFKTDIQKYYSCNKLVGNQCSVYESRPSICSNYPNYPHHDNNNPISLINQIDCGYYLDTNESIKIKGQLKDELH
jgi:Fe-S-cluster containining protein